MDQNQNVSSVPSNVKNLPKISEIFSSTNNFYKKYWKILVGISVLPALVSFVAEVFKGSGADLIALPISIVGIILYMILPIILISTIDDIYKGNTIVNTKEKYKMVRGIFWAYLYVYIITGLIIASGTILFIIPGIILAVYISMSTFGFILDGKRGFGAISYSYSIVKGRWLPFFYRIFVALIVASLVSGFLALIFQFVFGSKDAGAALSGLLVTSFLIPYFIVYQYNLYISLRNTKMENVDEKPFKRWVIGIVSAALLLFVILAITIPIFFLGFVKGYMKEGGNVSDLREKIRLEINKADRNNI